MADLPDDLIEGIHGALTDLRRVHLAVSAWPAVAGDLGRLAAALDRGNELTARAALLPLSQAAFEGKVRGRLAGADRRAAMVTATKPTSSLPLVGGMSGLILMVVGYLIGGWVVLAGTAAFALFIFGIAIAGTRTNLERTEDRRARRFAPTREPTEPAPIVVVEAIQKIEASLFA